MQLVRRTRYHFTGLVTILSSTRQSKRTSNNILLIITDKNDDETEYIAYVSDENIFTKSPTKWINYYRFNVLIDPIGKFNYLKLISEILNKFSIQKHLCLQCSIIYW